MKANQISVHIGDGVKLVGEYYKGFNGSDVEPPEPENFEIYDVIVNGVNVTESLGKYIDFSEMQKDAIREIKSERGHEYDYAIYGR